MASKLYEIAFQLGAKLTSTFGSTFATAQGQLNRTEGTLSKLESASTKAHKGLSNMAKGAIGLAASMAGGAGLFAYANSAIEAGNATYELSQKMHLPAAEAGTLNKMLKMTNTDAQPFISTMLKLDKGLETAGDKGNTTTKALDEYGISLKDAHGKLLPMNEQLAQLAKAYQKASESGNEEAFTATVLGAKGSALAGILADYNDVAVEAAKTKSIGIDPNTAHDAYIKMQALKSQMSQFGLVASNALIPIVSKMIPPLQSGMANLATVIKNNQPQIKKFGENIIQIGTEVSNKVAPVIKEVFNFVANHGEATKAIVLGIGTAFLGFKAVSGTIGAFQSVKGVITDVGNAVNKLREKQLLQTAATNIGKAATLAWSGITKAFTAVQAALNVVMAMNPFILITLAIVGLIAVFVILFNKNKAFHDFVIAAWTRIKVTVGNVIASIIVTFGKLKQGIDEKINSIFQKWNAIKNSMSQLLNAIKNSISQVLNNIKNSISQVFNTIKNFIGGVWKGIINAITSNPLFIIVEAIFKGILAVVIIVTYNIYKAIDKAWASACTVVRNALTQVRQVVVSIWNAVYNTISSVLTSIRNAIVRAWKAIYSSVANVLTQIWQVIVTGWNVIYNTVANALTKVWQVVVSIWNTIYTAVANALAKVWQVIVTVWAAIYNSVSSVLATIWNFIVSVWNSIYSSVSSFVTSIWNTIVSGFNNAYTGVTSIFQSIYNTIVGIFQNIWSVVKSIINTGIGMVNGFIGGVNKVISVANNVPGVSISAVPTIPQLAQGGYIKHRAGGILANIGEGREDEIVSPVSKLKSILSNTQNSVSQALKVVYEITIQGNASEDDIYNGIKRGNDDLEKRLERINARRQRLSFEQG
jgi:hypothetical protein